MGIFGRIGEWLSRIEWGEGEAFADRTSADDIPQVNPATGLPMIGSGIAGVDVQGNPFGTDLHRWHDDQASRAFSDSSATHWDHASSSSSYDPGRGW